MGVPTGQAGKVGWVPVSAAAVPVCAACVCAHHHLASPPRAGTFSSDDALNCSSSLGKFFFFLFGLQSYSKFAGEVVEDGGWSECLWTVLG